MPASTPLDVAEAKADLFRALASPARIRILEVLATGEHAVGEIQPLVDLEASHLSQQLGILRRAGLVVGRKEGASVHYSIRDRDLVDLMASARRLLISSLAGSQELLAGLLIAEPEA